MELNLDFLTEQEIADLLDELGIAAHAAGEDNVLLEMGNDFASAKHCFCNDERPCDSGPDTFCIDIEKAEKLINKNTKVLIPVHLYGQSADMIKINKQFLGAASFNC